MTPQEIRKLIKASERAREIITELPGIADKMRELRSAPTQQYRVGTPQHEKWWAEFSAERDRRMQALAGPLAEKVAELRSISDGVLDVAEDPQVCGDNLDLSRLPALIKLFDGYTGAIYLPYETVLNLTFTSDQLRRFERRLDRLPAARMHTDSDHGRQAAISAGLTLDERAREARLDGKKLSINEHSDFSTLKALVDGIGAVVFHTTLLRAINPKKLAPGVERLKDAPPEVKESVTRIRKAFRNADAPYKIKSVRRMGFKLSPDE